MTRLLERRGQGEQTEREDKRQLLTAITRAGAKMSTIIDELLLLSSVRRGDVPCVALDTGAMVGSVIARLEPQITERGAVIRRPERWPAAVGHGPWIERARAAPSASPCRRSSRTRRPRELSPAPGLC